MVTEQTTPNSTIASRYEAYDATYWNSKGRYEELRSVVEALIPASGEVEEVV